MKYIDAHCHLNFHDYDADREAVIRRAEEAGVGMIVVGTGKESSRVAVELAEKYDGIWAIVGLHPIYVHEEFAATHGVFDREYYLKLAEHPKVVGIGECGYDYYRTHAGDVTEDGQALLREQHEAFLAQIELANTVGKLLMLHLRNGDTKKTAYSDAIQVVREHAKVKGDAHFFAGTPDEARAFLDLGFNISFTGVITFARSYDEVIRMVPLDRIMSETDAPYVTPAPHRGERNEPVFVTEVAHTIASVRGESIEKVLPQLVENARKLFNLK